MVNFLIPNMDSETQVLPSGTLSLKYVQIIRFFMISVGAWPGKALGEERMIRLSSYAIIFYMALDTYAIIGGFLFIERYNDTLSFYMLGDVYTTQFLSFVILFRSFLPWFKTYGVIIRNFFTKFHLFNSKHKGGPFLSMATKVDVFSNYYTILTAIMMVLGMALFNLTPMYNNFKNGAFTSNRVENYTLQFSVNYIFPGYDPQDYFIITTCVNLWMSYSCTIFVCVNDLLLSVMVFQIIGNIRVLKYNLEHFPVPKQTKCFLDGIVIEANMYDAEENKQVHKIISECVDHHLMIVDFVGQISSFFGPMLAFSYLYDLVSCCVLLLECSQGEPDSLVRYGPLTFIIFGQLIQSSVLFEFVGSQSETLIDSVYFVPWESMNSSNRRAICILLNRVQIPIKVTASGIFTVGVQTMIRILKTTFSYFAFLQTIEE